MLQLQLYIEGEQVELFKDESISLTQSIQDIKDISKVFTDFTKTFNVPASKQNNKIFKHFYNFNIIGFDARKKKPAQLTLNYKPFKTGKLKFEGVQLKNNEPHTYRLTFYGDVINLKDVLGDDKLANLAQLTFFDFDYNNTNITTYLSNGLDVDFFGGTIEDAIIFPIITHTSRIIYDNTSVNDVTNKIYNAKRISASTTYGVPVNEFKPALRLYAIVKAIENQVGYNLKFSEEFFNKTNLEFYNLYMWLHNSEGALFQDTDAQYQIKDFGNIDGSTAARNRIQGVTSKTFVNQFRENKKDRLLKVEVTPSGSAAYNLVIKKNGEEFKRFDNLTGVTTNGVTNNITDISLPSGTFTFFIETVTNSSYAVVIYVKEKAKKVTLGGVEIRFSGSASFATDKEIVVTTIVPDIKIVDFLTGIFKMFNLTALQNAAGIIEVKPLDEFFSSSTQTWDITKDLDKTQTRVDSVLPFKDISFKYKGVQSFLANQHKEQANTDWGGLDYRSSDKFDGKNYTIEIPFEHFKYEHLYVTDNGVSTGANSNIQYGYSVDKSQEPYLGEPLIFYAAKTIGSMGVLSLDLSTSTLISGPYVPLNSITLLNLFSTGVQNLNFSEEYDEFSREPAPKTLFDTYYKTYIKDIFDERKRLTTVKAYLPMQVLHNLSLADKIIVFDDEYRINKITTNFENNLSTLELTNIFEEVTYRTFVAIASNCLTADNIDVRASTIDVRASAACDSQFTIPSISTVVPNTTPSNNPQPQYFNVPLVVIAPIIADYQVTVPTNTSVFFNHQVFAMGVLGTTLQVDEYGFVYSETKSLLTASDDVDVLKGTSNVFAVPYLTTAAFTVPKIVNYEKSGLTHPKTYYWRFYARTNTDTAHAFADAISDCFTASTVASTVSQYGNTTGQDLNGYTSALDIVLNGNYELFSNNGGEAGVTGITLSNYVFSPQLTVDHAKEIMEWLTSEPNVVTGTYYNLSHTFKLMDPNGQDDSVVLNLSNATGAQAIIVMWLNAYPIIQIKGGTVTGTLTSGITGSFKIGGAEGTLQSTSG